MQLKGKNAIVTGANRGIGYAIVKKFASEGSNIWACARKYSQDFENDMVRISEQYDTVIEPIYFDLDNDQEITNGMKQILAQKKSVDILVNNAGIGASGLLGMTSINTLRHVFEINYFAQILIMQIIAKKMIRQKDGCIINMVSVAGLEQKQGYFAYGSSKAALIWATRLAAKEYGAYGIRVNGIAPAFVDTDMSRYVSESELQKKIESTPLRRMARPEEIADAAAFLASRDASFITGEILKISGGRV